MSKIEELVGDLHTCIRKLEISFEQNNLLDALEEILPIMITLAVLQQEIIKEMKRIA